MFKGELGSSDDCHGLVASKQNVFFALTTTKTRRGRGATTTNNGDEEENVLTAVSFSIDNNTPEAHTEFDQDAEEKDANSILVTSHCLREREG